MLYREIKPVEEISDFVNCFWVGDTNDLTDGEIAEIHPDGSFDIIVLIKKNDINYVSLTGIWTKTEKVVRTKGKLFAGVRFYPSAVDVMFKYDISQLINSATTFRKEYIIDVKGYDMELLLSCKNPYDIIDFFQGYLLNLIQNTENKSSLIKLQKMDYSSSVSKISKELNLSPRTLSRKMNERIGLSTKEYLRISRFIEVMKMLNQGFCLKEIVFQCGYYDQAHFIREFKSFTDKTPSEYIKND